MSDQTIAKPIYECIDFEAIMDLAIEELNPLLSGEVNTFCSHVEAFAVTFLMIDYVPEVTRNVAIYKLTYV